MSQNDPNPLDFCNVDALLSDDERALQHKMANFVNESVIPIASSSFDECVFPREIVSQLAKEGVLGCSGMNSVSYGLICMELERGDAGIRTFVSVQSSLVIQPIAEFGSEAQQKKWLPSLTNGEAIGCFALTEEQGGSDLSNMQTRAVQDGDDWIITGKKVWITNGSIADVAIVWAMTDDGCRAFLIEKEMEGFTACDIQRKYSLRASVTSNLEFDSVRVPAENMLPNVQGLAGPLRCLTNARFGIAWGAVGSAVACFEEVLAYTNDRILFRKPLAATQAIQMRLAEMSRKISTAQLLAVHLGRMKDTGTLHHSQISMAKWNNVRAALEVARDARDMLGANGVCSDFCTIRHMLNLETVITYEGTETVHELVIGRELTGFNAFS